MNRDTDLCCSFVRQAKNFLSKFPQVKHEWSIDADKDHCLLDIPEQCYEGFPVTVEVYPERIIIIASGIRADFPFNGNADDFAARVIGRIHDLLSPAMRIHEHLSGGRPYRWVIDLFPKEGWPGKKDSSLFFFNYFGEKTEKIYQNKVLPERKGHSE